MSKILIIEDNVLLCRQLTNHMKRKGLEVEYTLYAANARKIIATGDADLILSDIVLPDGDGVDILEWMCREGYRIPFIVMTDYASVQSAIRAMKLGAADYFSKPLDLEELSATIDNLLKNERQRQEQPGIFKRESLKIREVEKHARLVAKTNMSVLIRGMNGTGKEYVANLIHQFSDRAKRPFVAMDCGVIPKELCASEFFGYVKGAFTGATEDKTGTFHEAEGGTLFLDEIGNLSYEIQSSLLRVLQEKRYRPLGSRREVRADVRILAATNEDMEKAIREGRFREDLYHRLCEFEIVMPTLAECREDILPLAEFFRTESCQEMKKETMDFSETARRDLVAYNWPGNVRELKNRIKRTVLLAKGTVIDREDLGLPKVTHDTTEEQALPLDKENADKWRIAKALELCGGNKTEAAKMLQIDRVTLYRKLEKYGLKE